MNKKLISIIVPVFNVQNYLDKCITSLVSQTYKNIEIILVDDGSTDDSSKICNKWEKIDDRIKVIHKENQGLGMARNTGMENATGEYICFVDSDDTLDFNTIHECSNIIDAKNVDIVCYGFKDIDINDNILKEYIPTPKKKLYLDNDVRKEFLPNLIIDMPNSDKYNMNMSSCMCLIKKSIVDTYKWKFVSERDIISEDLYSLLILYKNINSVYVIDSPFYNYRKNYNSLTRVYKKERFEKIIKLYKELIKLYSDNEIVERFDYLFLSYSISCIKQIVNSNLKYKEKKKGIINICNNNLLRKIIKSNIKKESRKRHFYFLCILRKRINIIYLLTFFQNKK